MKLWAGRLQGQVDDRLNELNASIGYDSRMYRQDIRGSMAHARMLGASGVIPQADAAAIIAGLQGMLSDLETGALEIDMSSEDIHTFVEAELTKRIGDAGKKLHTARSRNDQVALDVRLYLADEIEQKTVGTAMQNIRFRKTVPSGSRTVAPLTITSPDASLTAGQIAPTTQPATMPVSIRIRNP